MDPLIKKTMDLKFGDSASSAALPDLSKLPQSADVNAQSITEIVHAHNANCPDERLKFIMKGLITHLHDFVRETAITEDEWMTAIKFLTATGQKSTDIREEFILLSDTLGVSTLINAVNNAKPAGATESTVLGPFFTDDARDIENGGTIASEGKGNYLFVEGRVTDVQGNPIANAIIDTWETDGFGQYDTQYENRSEPECRGRLHTSKDGSYAFRAVVPVAYSVPDDGPAPGYETLVTALYFKGDPFLYSDAVFGVKSSLIVDTETIADPALTRTRGFREEKPHEYLKYNFVLATKEEEAAARKTLLTS